MRKFTLVTDSSCDLPSEILTELNVRALPLCFNFKEEQYMDEKDESSMKYTDFYRRMREGEVATTSAVPVGVFEQYFEEEAQKGQDVLWIALSSGLSTTCSSAMIAAKAVSERYPERKLFVVDSLAASLGQGLFVYLVAKKSDEGGSIEEVRDYAEGLKLHICHFFTVDDLKYLKRGGRISAATALVGGLLNIKPLLHTDDEGHLVSIGKARGRKASIQALADSVKGNDLPETREIAFICHADCLQDAQLLADILKKDGFKKVVIWYTGAVIGAHSGPGTLSVFYVGGKR